MNVSKKSTFYYHADANALGGILKQPLERILSTDASVSLPAAGGFTASRHETYHVDGLVSISAGHAHVSGAEHKERGGHRTTATATIENLKVLDIVTADRIVAQISLFHPSGRGPTEISLLGSQFVNLQINGVQIHPTLDHRLYKGGQGGDNPETDAHRLGDLLKVAEQQHAESAEMQKHLIKKLGTRFDFADPETEMEQNGHLLCSLVKSVAVEPPGESFGHVIHIPDLGNIFLGELRVNRFAAELTMIRIEMGCIADGDVSGASARSNGRWMP